MKLIFNKLLALVVMMLISFSAAAQDKPEMADVMRSNGKIYVVVTVLVLILLGLFIYLISLERKIKKLEKQKY